MFFSQVEDKLVKRKYTSPEQFNADMRLAFDNCQLYNPPDDPFRKLGQKVEAEYDQLWVASGLADSETMEARGKRATAGVARPKYEPVAPSKPKDSQGGKRAKVGGSTMWEHLGSDLGAVLSGPQLLVLGVGTMR